MPDEPRAPSPDSREHRDPGRVPIAERWGPVGGRQPTGSGPSFRRRWFAAVLCMLVLIGAIALLG